MKKNNIGMLGMAALSLASLLGAVPKLMQKEVSPVTQNAQSGNEKINTISKDVQAPKPIDIKGAMNIFAGYGIPPHIYGMYHVRRGTHKQTNAI